MVVDGTREGDLGYDIIGDIPEYTDKLEARWLSTLAAWHHDRYRRR
jgi:hypothetical protein